MLCLDDLGELTSFPVIVLESILVIVASLHCHHACLDSFYHAHLDLFCPRQLRSEDRRPLQLMRVEQ